MLKGEAKKVYQREYMRDYMRRRRVKTQEEMLRPDVKTPVQPVRPVPSALAKSNAKFKKWR